MTNIECPKCHNLEGIKGVWSTKEGQCDAIACFDCHQITTIPETAIYFNKSIHLEKSVKQWLNADIIIILGLMLYLDVVS